LLKSTNYIVIYVCHVIGHRIAMFDFVLFSVYVIDKRPKEVIISYTKREWY
jgi:hypothetical protein